MNCFHVYVINFPSFYSVFSVLYVFNISFSTSVLFSKRRISVLYIFIISFSTSVLFSKRRKNVNLVDLAKSFPTSIYLQKSASIQPRTSLSKFEGKFNSLFIRLLSVLSPHPHVHGLVQEKCILKLLPNQHNRFICLNQNFN